MQAGVLIARLLLPQIYELYKKQKEKKFEVLAISIDTFKSRLAEICEKQ